MLNVGNMLHFFSMVGCMHENLGVKFAFKYELSVSEMMEIEL